jgi:hypothetical protein
MAKKIEKLSSEREQREASMEAYLQSLDRPGEEKAQVTIEIEKRFGLYCGACGHGNGCRHGVPAARW